MTTETSHRSSFLSALCILTFLGSGLSFLIYSIASLFFDEATEFIIKYSRWDSTDAISPFYFTMFMALNAISLTGAIRIWKLHRDGFYLYVLAQLLLLIAPAVWINFEAISVSNVIFTTIFIVGYGFNFKKLN